MEVWKELFTTDVGLAALAVLVVMIGMGFYIWRMIARKIRESDRR